MHRLREAVKRNDVTNAEHCLETLLGAASQDPAKVPLHAWNSMIQVYVGAGRRRRAEAVLEKLHSQGPLPNATSYLPFLGWHRSRRQSALARDTWSTMLERKVAPDIYCFNTLAALYADEGNPGAVEDLIASMAQWKVRPTRATYHTLLKGYVKSDAPERAMAALERMEEAGFPISRSTLAALSNELRRQGYLSLARETLRHPRALPPNREIVHSQLQLARATGDLRGALRAVRSLPSVESTLEQGGARANAATIALAVEVAGCCKKIGVVHELLDRMDREGIQPTAQLLTAVLGACRHVGDVDAARRFWERLVCGHAGDEAPLPSHKMADGSDSAQVMVLRGSNEPLTAIHFNVLVDLYANVGDMAAAHGVLSGMQAAGIRPTEVTWASLLLGPARRGNVEAAWEIAQQRLRQPSAAPGATAPSAAVWNALLVAYRHCGDPTGVEAVLDAMAKAGSTPTASTVRHMVDVWLQEPHNPTAPRPPSLTGMLAQIRTWQLPVDRGTVHSLLDAVASRRRCSGRSMSSSAVLAFSAGLFSSHVGRSPASQPSGRTWSKLGVALGIGSLSAADPPVSWFVLGFWRNVHPPSESVRRRWMDECLQSWSHDKLGPAVEALWALRMSLGPPLPPRRALLAVVGSGISGDRDVIEQWFAAGGEPDKKVFTSLLRACAVQGDWAAVSDVETRMRQQGMWDTIAQNVQTRFQTLDRRRRRRPKS